MATLSYIHFWSKLSTHLSSKECETSSSLGAAIMFTPEHPTTALNTQLGTFSYHHNKTIKRKDRYKSTKCTNGANKTKVNSVCVCVCVCARVCVCCIS